MAPGRGVSDGGGAWINTSNTWWNGTTNVNWADNYNARIGSGGAGGTITLDTVTANLVTFTNFSGTYTLTSGSLMVVSNLTVANSAGSVVLGYVIGGPGGVTMNSSGSLRLYGLSPNTYSGGTIINRGTLIWGTMVNGISPECNYALGTGPVTLNSGATLQFERANPTNALTLNGGTFYSQNGWGVTWMGPVTLNSNTTVRADLPHGVQRQHQRRRGLHQDGRQHGDLVRRQHLHRRQCGAGRHAVLLAGGFAGHRRAEHQQRGGGQPQLQRHANDLRLDAGRHQHGLEVSMVPPALRPPTRTRTSAARAR